MDTLGRVARGIAPRAPCVTVSRYTAPVILTIRNRAPMPLITPRRDRGGLSRHRRLVADLRTTINDVVQFQANPDLRPPFAALIAEAQRDPALGHLLLERFIRPRRAPIAERLRRAPPTRPAPPPPGRPPAPFLPP